MLAMIMRFLLFLFTCLLMAASPALADVQEPLYMQVFGRQRFTGEGFCHMGMTAEALKKEERKKARQRTLEYWCKENSSLNTSSRYCKIFKNEPVTYKVTFEGKSDFGTLHPTSRVSDEANKAALEMLKYALPMTTPPSDSPYRRGLLLRLTSTGLTVRLAPEKL